MIELQELRRYRRDLHRIPELDFDLPQTIAYIEGVLAPLACEVTHPCPSCVCAFFDAGVGATHATAIRADMDALPIAEVTGVAFASTHPGKMHACGHDGHMAMLLGAAMDLQSGRFSPKSNILLIFQPAEETTGGAKPILDSGVFEKYNVTRIFGMHLIPDLPKGALYTKSGAMMAKSCEITVDIEGKSSHIAKYEEGADALLAAAEFITQLYSGVDKLSDIEYKLLRFGRLTSGSVRNAVSPHSELTGSLRCFDENDFDRLLTLAKSTAARFFVVSKKGAGSLHLPRHRYKYPAALARI